MGVYVGTVERYKDGRIGVKALPNLTQRLASQHKTEKFQFDATPSYHPFGGWMECDIGKRVYRVGSILQMENQEQMEKRLAKIRHGVG